MALGSSWWSSDWRDNRLPGDVVFEAADITLESINTLWQRLLVSGEPLLYQREHSFNGNADADNGGMFYVKNEVSGLLTPAADVFKAETYSNELLPVASTADDIEAYEEGQATRFTSPFAISASFTCDWIATLTNVPPAASGDTFVVVHYGPWAWFGTPSQVIASILISVGITAGMIDTASFDNAYDV